MRTLISSRKWHGGGLLLIVLLTIVFAWKMDRPWTYNDDYNGAFWSQAAKNLNQAGFLATAGIPAPLYFGALPIPIESLYVHHPTLLVDLAALTRSLLGGSEAAARALPILSSVLTAVVLSLFVQAFGSARQSFFTLALFVAAPMELHYGQMVNFEAPELFFLLSALAFFYLWRRDASCLYAIGALACLTLAMWIDWPAYLMAMLVFGITVTSGRKNEKWFACALAGAAIFSGTGFLLQIHLANPDAWDELLRAFRERSGHGNLAGSTFTMQEWARTEFGYLTTLYHPVAWCLAFGGIAVGWRARKNAELRATAAILLVMNFLYICGLRNQSFVHDFAGFYLTVPLAIFGGQFLEAIAAWRPAASLGAAALCAGLIYSGVAKLQDIDTQFYILGDEKVGEPALLMPHLGKFISQTFPPGALVICNFDPYCSPLPYYAVRPMVTNLHTDAEWRGAARDADEPDAGGIAWLGAPGAKELTQKLGMSRQVQVDGVWFSLWLPQGK